LTAKVKLPVLCVPAYRAGSTANFAGLRPAPVFLLRYK
jgi:hypothetical protein